jgi:hypothetical protein
MTDKQSVKVVEAIIACPVCGEEYSDENYVYKSDYDLLLQELKDYREALEYISKNARGAIILSTQEGTKEQAFDFVVSTFEEKAKTVLNKHKAKSGGEV